jgi:DNA anti-recombination protein RmuC
MDVLLRDANEKLSTLRQETKLIGALIDRVNYLDNTHAQHRCEINKLRASNESLQKLADEWKHAYNEMVDHMRRTPSRDMKRGRYDDLPSGDEPSGYTIL